MPWPTHSVYVSWTTQPRATPVWVDISSYVKRVSWRSPTRRSDRERFDAATLTVVVNNEDRRFDPTYTAGAYYPNVKLMRRIKWDVTVGGTTYTKFEGFITRLPQTYQPPRVGTATIYASDAIGEVLSIIKLPDSPYQFQIDSESPVIWWRLNEGTGSTTLADSGAGGGLAPATISGTAPEFGAASLIYGDPSGAIRWQSGGVGVVAPTVPATILPSAYPFSIEGWFQAPTVGSEDRILVDIVGNGAEWLELRIGGTAGSASYIGRLVMRAENFTAGASEVRGTPSTVLVDDNEIHHFMAVFTNGTTFTLYIDGVDRTGVALTLGTGNPAAFQWRKVYLGNSHFTNDRTLGGVLDEVAVYNGAKSAVTAASHSALGTVPWYGQWTGERLGTILDVIGFPSADRQIDTGSSSLQSASFAGQTVLEHAQALEKTEGGLLFMEAGKVKFISRSNRYKAPYDTVQATFGDSTDESEYTDVSVDHDVRSVINEVRLTRVGGATQVASDATSDADYYTRTYTDDGFLGKSDSEILDRANWVLGRSKDPSPRFDPIRVQPTPTNGLFSVVVPLKVADRIRVLRRPQDVGSAIDYEVHIEGIEVEASDMMWVQTMTVSPADTRRYWRMGTAGYSEMGSTTRVGW